MRFLILSAVFLFWNVINSFSQSWVPVNNSLNNPVLSVFSDFEGDRLFLGGNFKFSDSILLNGYTILNANNFSPMGTGSDDCGNVSCDPVRAISKYKGSIYATAYNSVSGIPANGIISWEGNSWHSVGEGLSHISGSYGIAHGLAVVDDLLYVMGRFHFAGNELAYGIATWNGEEWQGLNFPTPYPDPESGTLAIYDAALFNNELYVCGHFEVELDGEIISDILKFDGNSWSYALTSTNGAFSNIKDLIVWQGELYACGRFRKEEGNIGNCIMRFDGDYWKEVGDGVSDIHGDLYKMVIYNDELIVGGIFNSIGDISAGNIAKWDGEKWCNLEAVFNNRIFDITDYKDTLFVVGGFTQVNNVPIRYIAKWDGGQLLDGACSTPTSDQKIEIKESSIQISPNPSDGWINVKFSGPWSDYSLDLSVFSLTGHLVKQVELHPSDSNIALRLGLPPGCYFVSARNENKLLFTKKIVFVR